MEILNVVSQSMIPACLIGILWEAFIKKAFVKYMRRDFNLNEKLDKYGIEDIFHDRSKIPLSDFIGSAKRRIWILVTSFSYLTETPGIQEKLILKARTKGVDLRILGLAPNTESAKLRSSFNHEYENLSVEMPSFTKRLKNAFEKEKEKIRSIQIRLYDKIPTCAYFIIDNRIFLCPLLCHKRGRETVHISISNSAKGKEAAKMFTEYEEHFKNLFNYARVEYEVPGKTMYN